MEIGALTQKVKLFTFSHFGIKPIVALNAKPIRSESLAVDISVAGSSDKALIIG